ncbi:DUF4214 domain-containing protein [Massilia agilis]|uniref:DUF4214 domain-containing protein n=1 Tax=Massilia agilis TaxID=1811226 RepID=A0ABT2DA26_9BURK|nr:DUF4214 domain-containing protein [Massilia agilis]MCS0808156.1 DUF4214 domain-containing protein [Massilia agilis]
MRHALRLLVVLLVSFLAGCGANEERLPTTGQTRLLGQAQIGTGELRIFDRERATYGISTVPNGYAITDLANGGKWLMDVQPGTRLRFADVSVVLDPDGPAAQAYRLYKAAFNRTPDAGGTGFWIQAIQSGVSAQQVADGFIQSDEFKSVYGGSPGSQQIVEGLYRNILGRDGEQAGIDFWRNALERGAATLPQVLVGFSESAENKAGVIGSIQSGIPFLEPGVTYVPIANAGANQIADLGRLVTLDGSLSTVSVGKPAIYTWVVTSRPAGSAAVLLQPASARPSFIPDQLGTYELSMTVSDGVKTSAVSKVSVRVLWRPSDSELPASGNMVYLASQQGDYVGGGATLLYTPSNALFKVDAAGATLTVDVTSDVNWSGHFVVRNTMTRLERGYYGDLARWPFHDLAKGGLDWSGAGRGCGDETGWFVVDSVTYEGTTLKALDLRFEQHCQGGEPALRGRIRWSALDNTPAPRPVIPPVPDGLWQPPDSATPQAGNYVYLASEQGDYIGAGKSYLYTGGDAKLTVDAADARVRIGVTGDQQWRGDFAAMVPLTALQAGYYGNITRGPMENPFAAGLSWQGEGRGCGLESAWFALDKVTYAQGRLTELDLRFELRCQGSTGRLHGKVHWSEGATTAPPGPVYPPPSGLWQPAPGTTPATGNFVLIDMTAMSGSGARLYVYTPSNAPIAVSAFGNRIHVDIRSELYWYGDLVGMESLAQLQVGYYGGLQRYPFNNPLKGGIDWAGGGAGCNQIAGWFVIDNIRYEQGRLTALDARFERRCEIFGPPLHGQIHWTAN